MTKRKGSLVLGRSKPGHNIQMILISRVAYLITIEAWKNKTREQLAHPGMREKSLAMKGLVGEGCSWLPIGLDY